LAEKLSYKTAAVDIRLFDNEIKSIGLAKITDGKVFL